MEITICYLLIYIIEAFIFIVYSMNVLTPKTNLKINRFVIILSGYGIIFLFSFLKMMAVNFISFLLINTLLILMIYEATLFMAAFHACLLTVIMGMCELISVNALMHGSYNFYTNLDYFRNLSLLTVVSKLLYFVIVILISSIINKDKEHVSDTNAGEVFLFIIPVFSAFVMMTFFIICYNINFSAYIDLLISVSSFLVLIINICVFGFYKYSKNRQQSFYELQLQLQKESDIAKYNKMLLVQDENQRILIHDIKKHLASLAYLNKNHETEKVDSYISHILDSSSLKESVNVCDNNFLNAVISRYISKANDMNILFHTDIRSKCIDFMSEESITSLFCNLLDNSIEAACKVNNPFIELTISNKENTPIALITVVNSCISSPFSAKTGKLMTGKSNPFIHGFGVKSIENVVKKYSGTMTMYYRDEDHTFHTVIALQE